MSDGERLNRRNQAQFGEMLRFSSTGWKPRPGGHRCYDCGGMMWSKEFGRTERFQCARCGHAFEVTVK